MKPALLVNENFPRPALRLLRDKGVTVESVEELMPGASDVEVLSYARTKELWLVTFDRDYGELVFARQLPCPPAVIYIRQEPVPPTLAAELLMSLLTQPQDVNGKFLIVSSSSIRRRALPAG